MQETKVETAVFREAILSLKDHLQAESTAPDEYFELYAKHFAPDSTPKEVDSLVRLFPQRTFETDDYLGRMHHSNLISLFGAVALHAGSEDLREFSLRKLHGVEVALAYRGILECPSAKRYHMRVKARLGDLDGALDLAKSYADEEGRYDASCHMTNVESIMRDMELRELHTPSTILQLCTAFQEAKVAHETATGELTYSKVVGGFMGKLYAARPHDATAFCKEHKLYTDLVLAKQAQGEKIPFGLLKQAERSTPATNEEKLQLTKALVQADRRKGIAKLQQTSNLGLSSQQYRDELRVMQVEHAAANGDHQRASSYLQRITDTAAKLKATSMIRAALIAEGDAERFCEMSRYYGLPGHRKTGTYTEYTVPMCLRKGDVGTAIKLIEAEAPTSQASGWAQLTQGLIEYKAANGQSKDITLDTILDYMQRGEDPERPTLLSCEYAEIYRTLDRYGLTDVAHALDDHIKRQNTEAHAAFQTYIQPSIQQGLLASGDWLEVMHGDYLKPHESLDNPGVLLLVVGGIHRARLRRKANQ